MSTDRSTKVIVGICAVLFIASIAVIAHGINVVGAEARVRIDGERMARDVQDRSWCRAKLATARSNTDTLIVYSLTAPRNRRCSKVLVSAQGLPPRTGEQPKDQ